MRKKRLTFLQRIGVALVGAGAFLFIGSVDPYSDGLLNSVDFLVRTAQAGFLITGGWILYRWQLTERRDWNGRKR